MTTPTDQTVREHIRLIVTPIVWDPELAAAVQADVERWVRDNADTIVAAPLAFVADRAVATSLSAVADLMDADPPDTARVALARRLAGATNAGRVAVALHELCGHDIATTAELSLRSPEDVHRLLHLIPGASDPAATPPTASIASIALAPAAPEPAVLEPPPPRAISPAPLGQPAGQPTPFTEPVHPIAPLPVAPEPFREPIPEPMAAPTAQALPPLVPPLTPPPVPSPDEVAPTGRPPRTVRLSTVVILGILFGLLWIITRGGGERPSFANAAVPDTLPDSNAQVITAGRGCDGPTGLAIGSPTTRSVRLSGAPRPYRVRLPTRYQQGQRLPLVIDLGDFGQSADQRVASSGWEDLSEEQSFIAVTAEPGGTFPQWNVSSALSEVDDVVYLDAVISDLFELACVDPARVWVSGHGDGGLMAAAYACERPAQIAAIVAVGGTFVPAGCALSSPVSMLAIHRDDDDLFPTGGGIGPAIDPISQNRSNLTEASSVDPESVTQSVANWAALSNCTADASPSGSDPEITSYQDCAGGASVELRSFAGGGHAWTSDDLAAAFTFFRDHPKKGL